MIESVERAVRQRVYTLPAGELITPHGIHEWIGRIGTQLDAVDALDNLGCEDALEDAGLFRYRVVRPWRAIRRPAR